MRVRKLKTLLPKLTIAALFIYGLAYMYQDANEDTSLAVNFITSRKLSMHKPRSHNLESDKIADLAETMVRKMQNLQEKYSRESGKAEEIGDSEKNKVLNVINQENDKERGREIFEEDLDDGTSWHPVNGYPKKTSKETSEKIKKGPPDILDEIFSKIPGGRKAVDAGDPEAKRTFEEILQEYNLKIYNKENDRNHKDMVDEKDAKFKSIYKHYMLDNQKRLGPLPDIRNVPSFFDPYPQRRELVDVPFDQKLDYLTSEMRDRVLWKMKNAQANNGNNSPEWGIHKDEEKQIPDDRISPLDNSILQRDHPELTKIITGNDPLVQQLLRYSELSGVSLSQLGQYAMQKGLNLQQLVDTLQLQSQNALTQGRGVPEGDLNYNAYKMFHLDNPQSEEAVNEMNKRIYGNAQPDQVYNQGEVETNPDLPPDLEQLKQNIMQGEYPVQLPLHDQFYGQNIGGDPGINQRLMNQEAEGQQQPQDSPEQYLDPKLLETFYKLRNKIHNEEEPEQPEQHQAAKQEAADLADEASKTQPRHDDASQGQENMKKANNEEIIEPVKPEQDEKQESNEIQRVLRSTNRKETEGEKVNQEVMTKQEVEGTEQEVLEKALAYMSEQEFELLMRKQNAGTTQISRIEMANIRVVVIEMDEDEEATAIGKSKVLTVNEYKKWKPQQFIREIANPVPKSKEKPTLMPYTADLLRPDPRKLIKDLSPKVDTVAIEKELKAERKRRIALGDDDLQNIPEVKEELLAAGKGHKIPNFVHFIWFTCHKFRIHHYMSMRSALIYQHPKLILFHTDCKPNGTYWNAILKEAGDKLRIVRRSPPEKIWGTKIEKVEHRSDVTRLQILLEVGGIYVDDDIIILKSLDPLRNETMVLGEENYDALANSIIMAKRSSWFLSRWYQEYQAFNNSKWSHSSCFVPWSLWLIFPNTIRVVKEKMLRPNWEEIKYIYHELWDWSENYSIHLYSRFMPVLDGTGERPLKELAVLNTTYGEIARHVIWGNKEPKDISQWL